MDESMHIKFDEFEELEKQRKDDGYDLLDTQIISEKSEDGLTSSTSQNPSRGWRLVDYHPYV